MSMPAKMTRPASGATVPLAMPNSVVLPAPLGPMTPSASPSASARSIARATTTAPKRLEIFSKARMAGMPWSPQPPRLVHQPEMRATKSDVMPAQARIHIPETAVWGSMGPRNGIPATQASRGAHRGDDRPAKTVASSRCDGHAQSRLGCPSLRQQLQLPAHRDLRRGLVRGDDQIESVALALPLSGDERSLGDVLHGLAGPLHRAHHRFVIGGDHGIEDRLRLQRLCALEHV